jgi:ArsR family transcriptional regulator, arsenate/arsenite/antimonite-responsive transcriptional repressor
MDVTDAVAALAALAHEHRLKVYRLLIEAGPAGLNAGAIAQRLKLPPSSLTFHLQHLHRAELITQQRNSRQLIYAADFAVMNGLVDYLTENCCAGAAACDTQCKPAASATRKTQRRSARAA